jgi:hypothetical protein
VDDDATGEDELAVLARNKEEDLVVVVMNGERWWRTVLQKDRNIGLV